MTRRFAYRAAWFAASLAVVSLAGCGGGGGDDDPPAPPPALTEIPDSALASPTAYTEFALGLAVSETAEPFSVEKVSRAPTDDTSEPVDFD